MERVRTTGRSVGVNFSLYTHGDIYFFSLEKLSNCSNLFLLLRALALVYSSPMRRGSNARSKGPS